MIDAGLVRTHINGQISRVRHLFKCVDTAPTLPCISRQAAAIVRLQVPVGGVGGNLMVFREVA